MESTATDGTRRDLTTDERIVKAMRLALDRRGETVAELGRRLMMPGSTWARKVSMRPGYHQRLTAEDVERIARALGLTLDDLYSGMPL